MLYVPIRSDRAADLSAGIQQLTRPPHVRKPEDGCRYWCDWIDHPSNNGWSVLIMPETAEVPVHIEADGKLLGEVLGVFLSDGRITEEEFAGLLAAVPAMAGQTVVIADLIPPSWRSQVMDRDGAIAAGFIPGEEATP